MKSPHTSTTLTLEHTRMSCERTMMAWTRSPDMPRSMSGIVSVVVGAVGVSTLVAALVRA